MPSILRGVYGDASDSVRPQTPPSAPVTVVNRATNPVPVTGIVGVTNTLVPVRLVQESVEPGNNASRFSDVYTVPAGERLVVEHFSCSMVLQPPDALACAIEEHIGGPTHSIAPAHTPVGIAGVVVVHTGQAVKVIFEAGESFNALLIWSTPNIGSPGAFFSLSGYLEDAA